MTKLKIGDLVTISKDCCWYDENAAIDSDNPNCVGVVTWVDEDFIHCYDVQWSNGTNNKYMVGELDHQFTNLKGKV